MAGWVHELVAYMAEHLRGFAEHVEGAHADEIERLESLAGPLPEAMRDFLEILGRRDGGLMSIIDMNACVDDVAAFYEELPPLCPEGFVVFALDSLGRGQLALEVGAGRVVLTADEVAGPCLAGSLPGLLWQTAYLNRLAHTCAHHAVYAGPPGGRLDAAVKVLEGQGLVAQPFTDAWTWCGSRDGVGAVVYQAEGQGVWMRISGPNQGVVRELGDPAACAARISFERWMEL